MSDRDDLLDERARRLAQPAEHDGGGSDRLLVVRAGSHRVGVAVHHVRQVATAAEVTPVRAGTAITGIVAVHGEIVPVVDLGALLTGTEPDASPRQLVVIDDEDDGVGLLVDDVIDLVTVDGRAAGATVTNSALIEGSIDDIDLLSVDALLAHPSLAPPGAAATRSTASLEAQAVPPPQGTP